MGLDYINGKSTTDYLGGAYDASQTTLQEYRDSGYLNSNKTDMSTLGAVLDGVGGVFEGIGNMIGSILTAQGRKAALSNGTYYGAYNVGSGTASAASSISTIVVVGGVVALVLLFKK